MSSSRTRGRRVPQLTEEQAREVALELLLESMGKQGMSRASFMRRGIIPQGQRLFYRDVEGGGVLTELAVRYS